MLSANMNCHLIIQTDMSLKGEKMIWEHTRHHCNNLLKMSLSVHLLIRLFSSKLVPRVPLDPGNEVVGYHQGPVVQSPIS